MSATRAQFAGKSKLELMVRLKHISGEAHEHHKQIDEAVEELIKEKARILDVRHAALSGPYQRLMCSTIILYEDDG